MSIKAKKGELVALIGFTGIYLSDKEVHSATKTEITLLHADGRELTFDRKTGKQTNLVAGKEQYANKIMNLDEAPEKPVKKARTPKAKPVKSKKPAPVVDEEDEDDEDEDEAPAPKPKKGKKPAPVVEDDDDEDEDEPVAPPKKAKKAKKPVEIVEDDDDDDDDDED